MGNYSRRETFSDKFSQSSLLPDTLATLEEADMMCFFFLPRVHYQPDRQLLRRRGTQVVFNERQKFTVTMTTRPGCTRVFTYPVNSVHYFVERLCVIYDRLGLLVLFSAVWKAESSNE